MIYLAFTNPRYPISRKILPERLTHYSPNEQKIQLGESTSPVPYSRISITETLNNLRTEVTLN